MEVDLHDLFGTCRKDPFYGSVQILRLVPITGNQDFRRTNSNIGRAVFFRLKRKRNHTFAADLSDCLSIQLFNDTLQKVDRRIPDC